MAAAAAITLLLLLFAVDWRHFRDWIAVFLFTCTLALLVGSPVCEMGLVEYPVRLFPEHYDTPVIFEAWVFPVLSVLYNQAVRERGPAAALGCALLFAAGVAAVEYPLGKYTDLIRYIRWTWLASFVTLAAAFLLSRAFLAFFRWGCDRFGPRPGRRPR